MSSLRGQTLISAHAHIPPTGAWWAKCVLSSGGAPALGAADLVIGDLTLRGAIVRSGVDTPDAPAAVVVGGAGWRTLLPREGRYSAAGGVRLLTVLADLARLTGETYTAPADVSLGTAYEWPAATLGAPVRASAVLDDLVARGAVPTWRVDPATGYTRFDAWPSLGAADGRCQIVDRDLRAGIRHVALDGSGVAALVPGATLEGETVRRLVVDDAAGALTAEAWTDTAPTMRKSMRALIYSLAPWLAFVRLDDARDLVIRSASTRIHLAGDRADPAVSRVGDLVVRACQNAAGQVFVSTSTESPYSWAALPLGSTPISLNPTTGDAGTELRITTGSERVTCR